MIDNEKLKNVEDPEIKAIMERMQEFVYPKFEELQEMLSGDKKPNLMKMLKVAKDFTKKLRDGYKEKYNLDMEEDVKKLNKYMGISASPTDLINMFKKM